MRKLYSSGPVRRGFTLVELMVAAALCVFIMAILAYVFQRSLDTFRNLRATADLQDKLRAAMGMIRQDLAAQHFDGDTEGGLSGPYVRDQRLDLLGWHPPEYGYFEAETGVWTYEGVDPENLASTMSNLVQTTAGPGGGGGPGSAFNPAANPVEHAAVRVATPQAGGATLNPPGPSPVAMRFTVKLAGNRPEAMFYTADTLNLTNTLNLTPDFSTAGQVFASPWAEVSYFLYPQPGAHAGNNPLYLLYRRQRLLLPTTAVVPAKPQAPYHQQSAEEYAVPPKSIYLPPPLRIPYAPLGNGTDVLLSNVVGFQILMNWTPPTFVNVHNPFLKFDAYGDWPFAPLSSGGGLTTFDTGNRSYLNFPNSSTIDWFNTDQTNPTSFMNVQAPWYQLKAYPQPLGRIRVRSMQIKVRIWDPQTQTTRQVTIVQDL